MNYKGTLKERVEYIAFLHKQNLNGRETEDELFESGILAGIEETEEQILDFLYSEITERRDYSASKMCEKVIEFIEQFKNK